MQRKWFESCRVEGAKVGLIVGTGDKLEAMAFLALSGGQGSRNCICCLVVPRWDKFGKEIKAFSRIFRGDYKGSESLARRVVCVAWQGRRTS